MKLIENIFGFDCGTCEYNRHCYGGNMGNQFRYCQKSAEKIQNLDNLEKQNKQLKDDLNMLKDDVLKENQELKLELSGYRQAILNNKEMLGLKEENKKLKEQLSVTQTNEETFRLEMVDITKILGLDEHTLFDDVKVYARSLKDNWNKLKKDLELVVDYGLGDESSKWDKIYGEYAKSTLKFMQELEQGSDSNE